MLNKRLLETTTIRSDYFSDMKIQYIFLTNMKILVTGCNGLLGQHLVPLLGRRHRVLAVGMGPQRVFWPEPASYQDMDIRSTDAVRETIRKFAPDVLVHAAAMTQVDDCERNREGSLAVNVHATEKLLDLCSGLGTHFIFLSTDFVFDGKKGNYREDDAVNPINWYGETKVMAERAVTGYPGKWCIARTCLLYGLARASGRSTIISWIRSSLEKGERIRVVNDQVRTPTQVNDFARGISRILEQGATGIFHLSGEEIMTPYALALATADHFSLDKSLIEAVDARSFSQPGRRPLKTGFIIDKARETLGYAPVGLKEGLQEMIS
jgi:dTDP-4-dehydrorhamnose reductase